MAVNLRTTDASETFRALMTAVTRVNAILADEMEVEIGMSLERYGILLMLSQAEDGAMRPSELADGLPLTRSGTTRLVDRFERDGLIERRSCPTDRRGNLVALTSEGERAFRKAGRVHLRGIDEHVGSHLTGGELAQLAKLLEKLSRV
jgi:DNA-binding MarR family transcriptional regulator